MASTSTDKGGGEATAGAIEETPQRQRINGDAKRIKTDTLLKDVMSKDVDAILLSLVVED